MENETKRAPKGVIKDVSNFGQSINKGLKKGARKLGSALEKYSNKK